MKRVIRKVLSQQQKMFKTGNYSIPDKIVSIAKPYIRPIIRGKEVNKVEFGAKVNMIQVDGINFIEYLSFDAFNEGTRLIESVRYSRTLLGKITHISADAIYGTNVNRKWCTGQKIVTNFKRKGHEGSCLILKYVQNMSRGWKRYVQIREIMHIQSHLVWDKLWKE